MTTHLASIARPYAQAALEYAKDQSDLDAWQVFLNNAAALCLDPSVSKLIASDALNKEELTDLFHHVLKSSLNEARVNFLRLLIQNKRIVFLSDIAALFESLLSAYLKKSNVRLVTAVDASNAFKENLSKHLSSKLNKEIVLHCEKDPSILGGAIVYLDNQVIDGSIRGKLNRLLEFTLR